MNDKTVLLLSTLAEKLGVTAEFLWAALLRQAPVTGTVDLVLMVTMVALWAIWVRKAYREHVRYNTEGERDGWGRDTLAFAWLSVGLLFLLVLCFVGSLLSLAIAAFFNPEYWALRQILK